MRDPNKPNVEGGSVLMIQNSIAGGILNNGPASSADGTVAASISGNGTLAAPTVVISPNILITTGQMTIGVDSADAANPTYSFINRGSIVASPEDPNQNAEAIQMSGTQSIPIVFQGSGLLNSGSITAGATSATPGSAVSATAMEIGSFVTLPTIRVSAQTSPTGTGGGSISAIISGPQGGIATAISIDGAPINSGTIVTKVPEIDVERGASITASASATVPTGTTISTLSAIGIRDVSNSLTTINNAGSIRAVAALTDATTGAALTLTGGTDPITHAVDASLNSVGLNFTNSGTVQGDVLFGTGNDTYLVQGTGPSAVATHTGAINFGFSSTTSGSDILHVGQFSNVAGTITAQGTLDVTIDGTGTLSVQNVGSTLATRNLTVAGGSTSNNITNAGTLNITVSQDVTVGPVISASQSATLSPGAQLNVTYGSFITTSGSFALIQTPLGGLNVSQSDVDRYSAQVGCTSASCPNGALPFLFNSASIVLVPNDGQGHEVLQLNISAKTVDSSA